MKPILIEQLRVERMTAVDQAYDALARYKFWMFGYYAARAVFVARLIRDAGGPRLANPFSELVAAARAAQEARSEQAG